jgi:predicted aconitase with swiveling domain
MEIAGKILVLLASRGYCTGSGVLLQAIYTGHTPAAIQMKYADEIISLGAIVANEIFRMKISSE